MTPVQIAYFKHFLFDKQLQRIFITKYKERHLKSNPDLVEEFLLNVDVDQVFIKAFYFELNSQYGFDFWNDLNDKWLVYWDSNSNNFSNDGYITLRKTFAILRQNWDAQQYYLQESPEETYARMHIEPPAQGDLLDPLLSKPAPSTQKQPQKPQSSGGVLSGFVFADISPLHGGRKIANNKVVVNTRNGFRLSLPQSLSNKLRDRKYDKVRVASNKDTREIALFFNSSSGAAVNLNTSRGERYGAVLNSKSAVTHIVEFFKITEDYLTLDISATISQPDSIIIKLKLPA